MGLSLVILIAFFSTKTWAGEVNNGGNLIPEDQIAQEDVIEFVSEARGLTYAYLLRHTFLNGFMEQLLLAKPSVFEVMENTKIKMQLSKACKDENLQDSDASSVDQDYPDAICMSIPRLKSKLQKIAYSPHDYKYQIMALLIHEYSHRVGFNEDQAKQLQRSILVDLRKGARGFDSYGFLHESWGAREAIKIILSFGTKNQSRSEDAEALHLLSRELSSLTNFARIGSQGGAIYLSEKEYATLIPYYTIGEFAEDNMFFLGSKPQHEGYFAERYKRAFRDRDIITVKDYLDVISDGYWANLVKKYPSTESTLKMNLKKLNEKNYRQELIPLLFKMIPALEETEQLLKMRAQLKDTI